ncbi:hypothetical protein Cni_G02526 [Canna indica]|uniref:Reverse transcriptase n=1 Tax=Canna indica TaxID=4628 RepID=A0AAQ3Q004_9LILI|nr:hypothetical protein Cni_G02526 [Canna indica]
MINDFNLQGHDADDDLDAGGSPNITSNVSGSSTLPTLVSIPWINSRLRSDLGGILSPVTTPASASVERVPSGEEDGTMSPDRGTFLVGMTCTDTTPVVDRGVEEIVPLSPKEVVKQLWLPDTAASPPLFGVADRALAPAPRHPAFDRLAALLFCRVLFREEEDHIWIRLNINLSLTDQFEPLSNMDPPSNPVSALCRACSGVQFEDPEPLSSSSALVDMAAPTITRRAGRREFFTELEELLLSTTDNLILGNDFSITRFANERRNCSGFPRDSAKLSSLIADHYLIDLPIKGKTFTWSNNQQPPGLAKLDRILISSSIFQALPPAFVIGGERELSDHNALIFRPAHSFGSRNRSFRLECLWLDNVAFRNIILSVWSEPNRGESATTRWICRWKRLRNIILLWAEQFRKNRNVERKNLEYDIENLNVKTENSTLSVMELSTLKTLKGNLDLVY